MRGAQPAAYNRLVIKPGPRYANSSASFKTGSAFPQRQPAQFFLSWTCRPGQVKADVHLAPCPLFPQSGHVQCNSVCLLCARSAHDPMS